MSVRRSAFSFWPALYKNNENRKLLAGTDETVNKKVSGTDCVHGSKLTQIDSSATHVAEDAAGNMTRIPQPTSWSAHFDLKYDAWNRLVEVKDGANLVQTNEFDGLGRRIVRSVFAGGSLDHRVHYYYNENWQILEERKEISGTEYANPLNQYVWHPYYIDALAVRWYDSDVTTSGGVVQYYALQDANFNVTAVTDSAGAVQERYAYAPYGEVTFLNPDFTAKSTSTIGNTHLYTGRERDPETGLQLNRERYYASHLGRWLTRDPIDYGGGANLYEYTDSRPILHLDPYGRNPVAVRCVCYAGAAAIGYAAWATDWGTDSLDRFDQAWVNMLINQMCQCFKKVGDNKACDCLKGMTIVGIFERGKMPTDDISETRNGRCFGYGNRTILSADFFDRPRKEQYITLLHESYHSCTEDWTEDKSYDYANDKYNEIEACLSGGR